MCDYFSCILLPNGEVRWCEDNSHEETIARLQLPDRGWGTDRKFLRVEVTYGLMDNYRLDESVMDDMPTWFAEHPNEYRDKVELILKKLNPIHEKLGGLYKEYNNELNQSGRVLSKRMDKIQHEHEILRDEGNLDYDLIDKRIKIKQLEAKLVEAQSDYASRKVYLEKRRSIARSMARVVGYTPKRKEVKNV